MLLILRKIVLITLAEIRVLFLLWFSLNGVCVFMCVLDVAVVLGLSSSGVPGVCASVSVSSSSVFSSFKYPFLQQLFLSSLGLNSAAGH